MKDIIFVAAPAAGKGTQSKYLVDKYNFIHISTGDLLRDEVNKKTTLGNSLKEMMGSGKLISDDIVNKLLQKRLEEVKELPKIFDGYPRTLEQAKLLDTLIADYIVIYLNISYEEAKERVLGRVVCPNCKTIYKADSLNSSKCLKCGNDLIKRKDDNEETFKERFLEYQKNTAPLLDYYKNCGKLVVINGGEEENKVFANIVKVVEE